MHAPKSHILKTGCPTNQAAFDLLRKTKLRWTSAGFSVQAIPCAENDQLTRFCVIASKKTCAKAVDRNRLRRRIRAVALETLSLHAQSGMTYMIVGRSGGLTNDYETMRRDMLWCLKRMDLLNT